MDYEKNDKNPKVKPTILAIGDGGKSIRLRKAIIKLIEQEETNKHEQEHNEEER